MSRAEMSKDRPEGGSVVDRARAPGRVRSSLVIGLVAACAVSGLVVLSVSAPAGAAAVSLIPVGESHQTYTSFSGVGTTVAFSSPAVGDVTGDGVPEIV